MAADLPPDPIVDLAGACVRFVERALGLTLDFTQDTLPVLDHYLAQLHEEKRRELQEVVAPAAGAYFGEVLRRTLGDGTWYTPDNEYNRWRLEFGRCFLHLNPIGVSVESIIQGDAAGWNAHIQVLDAERPVVAAAIERFGVAVRREDYYSLAMRFEIIEQVWHSLVVGEPNDKGKSIDHATYEAVIGKKAGSA